MTRVPSQARGWRLPASDLQEVLAATRPLWNDIRGARLLMTGMSGFFGAWLVESALWIDQALDLGLRICVAARDPQRLLAEQPHWSQHPRLEVFGADVTSGPLPPGGFDLIVHGAAETNIRGDRPSLEPILMTSIVGTRRVLDDCVAGPSTRMLFLSSGAVYGRQPPELDRLAESYPGAPSCEEPRFAYGHGKRAAEVLLNARIQAGQVHGVSARCFAFIGPGLPLDANFAAGNFLRDVLAGRDIVLQGDGTAVRTYLYGSDMAAWAWTLLLRGRAGAAYNVGGHEAVSILELARTVQHVAGAGRSAIRLGAEPVAGRLPDRYVPDVSRIRSEFTLPEPVGLREALRRTLEWHRTTR